MTSSQLVALAALALLLASVVCDLRGRTIPDWISVALLALGVVATAFGWHDLGWLQLATGAAVAFGLGAALIVVASILVQRMQWYRRKEMVPGWLWTIIRILGLFRGQNSADRSPPAASDT